MTTVAARSSLLHRNTSGLPCPSLLHRRRRIHCKKTQSILLAHSAGFGTRHARSRPLGWFRAWLNCCWWVLVLLPPGPMPDLMVVISLPPDHPCYAGIPAASRAQACCIDCAKCTAKKRRVFSLPISQLRHPPHPRPAAGLVPRQA